ncbi:hypothetical protein ACMBCM_08710, partial [Spiroplasma sp. K1]
GSKLLPLPLVMREFSLSSTITLFSQNTGFAKYRERERERERREREKDWDEHGDMITFILCLR